MESKHKSSDRDPSRKPSEKKPASQSNNTIWYLLALGVLLLLLVSVWRTERRVAIEHSDLRRLVEASNPKNPAEQRFIEVEVGPPGKRRDVRYSNLADLLIEDYAVQGTVTVLEQVSADETDASKTDAEKSETSDSDAGESETGETDAGKSDGGKSATGDKLPGVGQPRTKETHNVAFTTHRRPNDQNRLADLLDENGVKYGIPPGPSPWKDYVPLVLLTGLFVVIIFVMMRRLGGAGSPMAFGRSRGKMYVQEDIDIMFGDVAGVDEAVEEVREVVEFLRTPEKYQLLGGRIPKGVLLVGPPGTGKTLLAKAIAGEAGVPFFSLSGSDFVEMFVGVGAARVRDMFQQAEAKAPCIIFIDELDALGKTRGSGAIGGHDEREQTLNALLVEMDGFDSNSGVIVLAATNRPETLDPALLRPGRFDREVLVDRPDLAGRMDTLKVHLRNIKVDDSVDVKQLAAITSGFVGADLANLVNEAALLAARNGKSLVGMQEFNDGVERVTAGLEKKQRVMQPDEKQRVAYHEAGHALVAYSLPNTLPVHKVSIIPRGRAALGYTMQRPEQDRFLMTQGELESNIQVLLAGTVTEEMFFDEVSTGAQNDLERASEIARSMVMDFGMSRLGRVTYRESSRTPFLTSGDGMAHLHSHSEQTAREIDEEVKRIVDESIEKVRHILETRKDALVAVSNRLLEREVIDADELRELIEAHSPSPMIVPGTDAERKRSAAEAKPQAQDESPASGSGG